MKSSELIEARKRRADVERKLIDNLIEIEALSAGRDPSGSETDKTNAINKLPSSKEAISEIAEYVNDTGAGLTLSFERTRLALSKSGQTLDEFESHLENSERIVGEIRELQGKFHPDVVNFGESAEEKKRLMDEEAIAKYGKSVADLKKESVEEAKKIKMLEKGEIIAFYDLCGTLHDEKDALRPYFTPEELTYAVAEHDSALRSGRNDPVKAAKKVLDEIDGYSDEEIERLKRKEEKAEAKFETGGDDKPE